MATKMRTRRRSSWKSVSKSVGTVADGRGVASDEHSIQSATIAGDQRCTRFRHSEQMCGATLSQGSVIFASTSGHVHMMRDAACLKGRHELRQCPVSTIGFHVGPLNCVAASNGATPLAVTGGHDGVVLSSPIPGDGREALPSPSQAPRVVHEHHGEVRSVDISSDGSVIVSGGCDCRVLVHSPPTPTLEGAAALLTCNPALSAIATMSLPVLEYAHEDVVNSVAVSPCGRFVASGGDDGHVLVSDLSAVGHKGIRTPQRVQQYPHSTSSASGRCAPVHAVALSSGGDVAAFTAGAKIFIALPDQERLRERRTYCVVRELHPSSNSTLASVVLSHDGFTVACGTNQGAVWVYCSETAALLHVFRDHSVFFNQLPQSRVTTAPLSDDGNHPRSDSSLTLNAGSSPGPGSNLGSSVRSSRNGRHSVSSISISPDGYTIASSCGNEVIVRCTARGSRLMEVGQIVAGHHLVSQAVSKDGCTAVRSDCVGNVEIINTVARRPIKTFSVRNVSRSESSHPVAIDNLGTLFACGSADGTVTLFSRTQELHALSPCASAVTAVAIGHVRGTGTRIACGTKSGSIYVSDTTSGSLLQTMDFQQGVRCSCLDFGADGDTLVSGNERGEVLLSSAATATILRIIDHHVLGAYCHAVALSSDLTRVASSDSTGRVIVTSMKSGAMLHSFHDHQSACTCVCWSGDDSALASGGDDAVVVVRELDGSHSSIRPVTTAVNSGQADSVNDDEPQGIISVALDERSRTIIVATPTGSTVLDACYGRGAAVLPWDLYWLARCFPEVARDMLREWPAAINISGPTDGKTALHFAASDANPDVLKALVAVHDDAGCKLVPCHLAKIRKCATDLAEPQTASSGGAQGSHGRRTSEVFRLVRKVSDAGAKAFKEVSATLTDVVEGAKTILLQGQVADALAYPHDATPLGVALFGNSESSTQQLLKFVAERCPPEGRLHVADVARGDIASLVRTFPGIAATFFGEAGVQPIPDVCFKAHARHIGPQCRDVKPVPAGRRYARISRAVLGPSANPALLAMEWEALEKGTIDERCNGYYSLLWSIWDRLTGRAYNPASVAVDTAVIGFPHICNNRAFLSALCETTHMPLFATPLVRSVLSHWWRERHFAVCMCQLAAFSCLLGCLNAWLSQVYGARGDEHPSTAVPLAWSTLLFALLFMIIEVVQLAEEFRSTDARDHRGRPKAVSTRSLEALRGFSTNGWNVVDAVTLCTILLLTIQWLATGALHDAVSASAVISAHLKLLQYLRAFASLSALVAVLGQCFLDIGPFVAVLYVVVEGFAFAFFTLGEFETPLEALYDTLIIGAGELFIDDHFKQPFHRVMQLACIALLLVVMMNMLIAIVCFSFEVVDDKAAEYTQRERALLIRQNNTVLDWLARTGWVAEERRCVWLHLLEPSEMLGKQALPKRGRVAQLQREQEKRDERMSRQLSELLYSIGSVEAHIDDEVRRLGRCVASCNGSVEGVERQQAQLEADVHQLDGKLAEIAELLRTQPQRQDEDGGGGGSDTILRARVPCNESGGAQQPACAQLDNSRDSGGGSH